jgi:hypothetical protein
MSGFIAPALSPPSCRIASASAASYRKGLLQMRFIAHKHVWKFVCLLAVDVTVFSSTNARNVPSFMLITGFVLLVATLYYLIYNLLTFARLYGLSIKRKRRLASVLTGLIAGLVALQSIGELNSRDTLVLLPLVIIGYAYSFYGTTGTRNSGA